MHTSPARAEYVTIDYISITGMKGTRQWALPKAKRKDSRAYLALTMIQAIYRKEKLLKDLPAQERKTCRQLSVCPLVEAYFTQIKITNVTIIRYVLQV